MASLLTPPLGPDDHVQGPAGAPLELVMYGDFQCPYCAAAQPIVARVLRRLEGELRFAFRHLPLHEVHPDAQAAAEASEAAAAQGAFWEMHDRLYAARGRLEQEEILGYAAELGLDAERVRAELVAGAYAGRVALDAESGAASGVKGGTPSFFTNGVLHEDAFDAGSLVDALRSSASQR